ncbi:MAG TPA: zf-HC2 domain-containing protein [Pseudonocardiaceae bacterium]|nr:zf-HC2 domain-containing protein [Pseudonocardiaceae bacterium]
MECTRGNCTRGNCTRGNEALSARQDGEEGAAERGAVDVHLASCAACRWFADEAARGTRLVPPWPPRSPTLSRWSWRLPPVTHFRLVEVREDRQGGRGSAPDGTGATAADGCHRLGRRRHTRSGRGADRLLRSEP